MEFYPYSDQPYAQATAKYMLHKIYDCPGNREIITIIRATPRKSEGEKVCRPKPGPGHKPGVTRRPN